MGQFPTKSKKAKHKTHKREGNLEKSKCQTHRQFGVFLVNGGIEHKKEIVRNMAQFPINSTKTKHQQHKRKGKS